MVTHDDHLLGPNETFANAMANTVTRKAKTIQILDAAKFATLTYMYQVPGGEADAAPDAIDPATVASYPVGTELRFVSTFKLSQGVIKVVYLA